MAAAVPSVPVLSLSGAVMKPLQSSPRAMDAAAIVVAPLTLSIAQGMRVQWDEKADYPLTFGTGRSYHHSVATRATVSHCLAQTFLITSNIDLHLK